MVTGHFMRSLLMLMLMSCASYASGAWRHVAPRDPSAQDSGEGDSARPYRTLAYAMQHLQPGDTLKIHPGIYREALILPQRAWSIDKPTTIVGDSAGGVIILGTDVVTGWIAQGDNLFIKWSWPQEPQEVILDGKPLKQIGGTIFDGYPERAGHELAGLHVSEGGIWPARKAGDRDHLPPGSFFYDAARRELLIKTDRPVLPGEAVEVSTRPYLALERHAEGITIANLRFRYATTSTLSRQGAITLAGNGNTLRNLVIEDMDGAGIEIDGDNNKIVHCTITRSGHLGIIARGKHNRIIGNRVSYNNTRGFNKWWEAGGMKFIGNGGLHDSIVADNIVDHNHGDGIWFDWGNDANRVERNITAYNEGFGIHYEASTRATIVDNRAFANRQRGIYLLQSRESVVAHNLVVANGLEGIAIIDDKREDPKGKLNLRPYNNVVRANLIAWNKKSALILPGEQYHNVSDANLFLQDQDSPYFSMGWPKHEEDRKTLARWRQQEAQDRLSVAVSTPMATDIKLALAREDLRPNWSRLKRFQAMLTVPKQQPNRVDSKGAVHSEKAGPR